MITVFNRSELTVCGTLEQSQKVSAALEQAGIEYHVASHSRTSPSVFSAGTRERSGTFGQSAADSWTYTIYVKREDLERARACLLSDGCACARPPAQRSRLQQPLPESPAA